MSPDRREASPADQHSPSACERASGFPQHADDKVEAEAACSTLILIRVGARCGVGVKGEVVVLMLQVQQEAAMHHFHLVLVEPQGIILLAPSLSHVRWSTLVFTYRIYRLMFSSELKSKLSLRGVGEAPWVALAL